MEGSTKPKEDHMAKLTIEDQYRAAAKLFHHEEGECEIDDKAVVSVSDEGGAYVQAWVWVDDSQLEEWRKGLPGYKAKGA